MDVNRAVIVEARRSTSAGESASDNEAATSTRRAWLCVGFVGNQTIVELCRSSDTTALSVSIYSTM